MVPTASLQTGRRQCILPVVMTLLNIIESPFSWAAAGFGIGIGLGVTTVSVSLLSAGLAAFVIHLSMRGPANHRTEGRLFAGGGALMMGWLLGFVVHGLIF